MTPQVVAHRGASYENAEHTLGPTSRRWTPAPRASSATSGSPPTVTSSACTTATCGVPPAAAGSSRRWSLADLEQLDFASWKNPWADLDDEAPSRDESLDRVLTLRKLLETVADYDRRVELAIETKHPTRYGGLVEKRLVEMLRDFGWDAQVRDGPVRVMSFSLHRAAAGRAAGAGGARWSC